MLRISQRKSRFSKFSTPMRITFPEESLKRPGGRCMKLKIFTFLQNHPPKSLRDHWFFLNLLLCESHCSSIKKRTELNGEKLS